VEQHGHQVYDVIIDPVKLAYLAGLTLLLLELPADMPAQVRQRGTLCRLAAEMIEHAEQLVAAYRGGCRRAQRTEGNVATGMAPAADQLTDQRQYLLIGMTASRGRWHGTAGRRWPLRSTALTLGHDALLEVGQHAGIGQQLVDVGIQRVDGVEH